MFYDAVQNEIGAEMAYLEANKLNQQAAVAAARAIREEELSRERREKAEQEGSETDVHKGMCRAWLAAVFMAKCSTRLV